MHLCDSLTLCDSLIAAMLGALDGSTDCTWLVASKASGRSSMNLGISLAVSKGGSLAVSELWLSKVRGSEGAELGESGGESVGDSAGAIVRDLLGDS